jgi:hypothetical protein
VVSRESQYKTFFVLTHRDKAFNTFGLAPSAYSLARLLPKKRGGGKMAIPTTGIGFFAPAALLFLP